MIEYCVIFVLITMVWVGIGFAYGVIRTREMERAYNLQKIPVKVTSKYKAKHD